MSNLRMYNPEYYCEVTIRAQDGDFAFDLNSVAQRERIYGYFAEAAKRYGVKIFAFHFMSNHYHGLYGYDAPQQLVAFLAYLHGQIARLANVALKRRGTFWAALRVRAVDRDERSVALRIRYIMSQAIKAQIVEHPGQFPGPSTIDAMLYGLPLIGRRVDATQRCRDNARLVGGAKADSEYETWVEVPVDAPHCWAHLPPQHLRRLYRGMADEIAQGYSTTAVADVGAGESQVPGVCLRSDRTVDSSCVPSEEPEPPPPAKTPVVERRAEGGGHFRQGPVEPKTYEGTNARKRIPLLLSSNPSRVKAFEATYAESVRQYRNAKLAYRGETKVRDGAVHSAAIVLPAWTLLGTLPLRLCS